jgi:CheY-like chemotaxis protein
MAVQVTPQHKGQISPLPASNNDAKKIVSDILKRADQWIHKGDYVQAQAEISKAKELDPRNVYVLALEERIASLKKTASADSQSQKSEPPISRGNEQLGPPIGTVPKTEADVQSIPYAVPAAMAIVSDPSLPPQAGELHQHRSIELDSYKKALVEAWCDGALTEKEDRYLKELRNVLDLQVEICTQMEKHVKYECYQTALLRLLSDPSTEDSHATAQAELQHRFHISDEEHLRVLTQLMDTIQHKQRDKLLVIDDDERLLELLAESLEDNGFDVIALSTSDEAYTLLHKFTPDLILCDISLVTSSMCGVTFYEKIQSLANIQRIPFIFLTGICDDSLVRTSKELGIDDYLLKPISEELLISTLRGKLKRFKQLAKTLPSSYSSMAAA